MNIDEVLASVNPDIIEKFKQAIATRKWPDGRVLTAEQLETCMQTVIAYEHHHVGEEERTGYVPPKPTNCGPEADEPNPLTWKN